MSAQQLPDLIRFARHNSPYYRDLYASLPPHADRLTDLPVIDQQDFWAANTLRDNRVLTGPLSEATVYKTGGTTGSPKFSVYTRDEWRTFVTSFGQGLVDAGLRPGHRVADLFYAGELYASFLFVLDSLAHAPVDNVRLPIGGGAPLESTIPTLRELSAQVLVSTPTTLSPARRAGRLRRCPARLGGTAPLRRRSPVRGPAAPAGRRVPRAEARSIGYASVDAGLLGRPVPGSDTRVHRPFSPYTVVEILDDATGEPVTEPGLLGRVVVTSLFRRLMPIIRFPAGDRAEWTGTGPGHFRILGRAEEGVRVGPVSLYTQDVQNAVAAADTAGRVVGLQLVVRRWDGRDGLVLRLATAPGDDGASSGACGEPADGLRTLAQAVLAELETARPLYPDSVRAGFVHPPTVEWARHRDLAVNPRTGKLVRVLDERPTA